MMSYLKKVVLQRQIDIEGVWRFVTHAQKEGLLQQAAALRGKKIVHVNATAVGGGVAEILNSLVPYLRALGMDSDWYCLCCDIGERFFTITNKIHNALQGATAPIGQDEWDEYERISKAVAVEIDRIGSDVLVIHDPQPLLAGYYAHPGRDKIYFSHIDTSTAFEPVWSKLLPLINSYQRVVFSNRDYVQPGLTGHKIKVFTPAIDPTASKQRIIPKEVARKYLNVHGGVPLNRPLIAQVSRFDIWKNPLGVVQAFAMIKDRYPEVMLMMVGFDEAKDNPMAMAVYEKVKAAAVPLADIFLFFHPEGKNISEFTMMAQNGADVVVQNSSKEGFGLVVAEAMWKNQPVIGGPAAGIRKQIQDGKNGFIVKNTDELAEKIIYLLTHPKQKEILGKAARKSVEEKYLLPRLVLDHLGVYNLD